VLGCAKHLSSLLPHAAEAILIHKMSGKEFSANFALKLSEKSWRCPKRDHRGHSLTRFGLAIPVKCTPGTLLEPLFRQFLDWTLAICERKG
jgi:hypothetical protein